MCSSNSDRIYLYRRCCYWYGDAVFVTRVCSAGEQGTQDSYLRVAGVQTGWEPGTSIKVKTGSALWTDCELHLLTMIKFLSQV